MDRIPILRSHDLFCMYLISGNRGEPSNCFTALEVADTAIQAPGQCDSDTATLSC